MKHPIFEGMGKDYPGRLEEKYDRVLTKIEKLWESPEVHDYFSDLLLDKRGGRKGFPKEVVKDLIALRQYRELETFRAAERREEAIRQLADYGVPFTEAGFQYSFRKGDQQLIDLFVRAKFPLPAVDEDRVPLLMSALKRGHTIVARIVLGAGAHVNVRDKVGLTPLLIACGKTAQGYHALAGALIAKGANVNARDPLGNTPLLLALSGRNFSLARLLIEHGADVSVVSRKGESPLKIIEELDAPEAASLKDLMRIRFVNR